MLPGSFPYYIGKLGYHDFDEEHELITKRLQKTLYYGKNPSTDRPSLPLTEIAVEFFNESAPRELGKLDTYMASSSSRQTCMSPCSLMMGMLYIKRLRRHNMDYLQNVSSSDLFLISVMMASKFIYDEGVDDEVFNDEWAAASDMETEDINELERQFLSAIDWKLFVSNKEFEHMLVEIEKRIALSQGLDRGWFSYTDIWILTHDLKFLQLLNDLCGEMTKVIMVSAVAYVAGMLVMVGSTLLVTCLSTTLISLGPVLSTPSKPLHTSILESSSSVVVNCTNDQDSKYGIMTESNDDGGLEQASEMDGMSSGGFERASEMDGMSSDSNLVSDVSVPNILSQLWAVVTLQDSYMDFLRALREHYMISSVGDFTEKRYQNEEILCADGPCHQNARRNCQNVTNCVGCPSDYKYGHCNNCLNRLQYLGRGCQQSGHSERPSHTSLWKPSVIDNGADTLSDSFRVRCCCNIHNTPDIFDPGLLLQVFSDISIGFMTGLHNTPWPVLV